MQTESSFARRALAALGAIAITSFLLVGSLNPLPQKEVVVRVMA